MVRAGIVGLGRWGRSLVRAVQGRGQGIEFVVACTRTRAGAEAFCREQKVPLVDDYEALLRHPGLDAVVLATPHSQHEEQMLKAAAAGKHIFVEKPMTLTRRSADTAVAAAERAGVVLAVGFCRRFHPSIGEMRNRVRDGSLGTLVSMVGQQTSGTAPFMPPGGWRLDPREAPAGAMTAVGVHLLDHMIEFAGRIARVHCISHSRRGGSDDTTTALLQFESGLAATIFCSTATTAHYNFTVYGTKGAAEISRTNLQAFQFVPAPDGPPEGHVTAPPGEKKEFPGFEMLNAELVEFGRCIREKQAFPVKIDEVLHGISVFEAIVEASRTGRVVEVVDR